MIEKPPRNKLTAKTQSAAVQIMVKRYTLKGSNTTLFIGRIQLGVSCYEILSNMHFFYRKGIEKVLHTKNYEA